MDMKNSNTLKVYTFFCANSFDGDEIKKLLGEEGDEHKIINIPCSGKVDMLYILKAFETGADGLALVTCPQNECRHLEGNLRAVKRAEQVNILLEETGMGGNRVEVFAANGNGIEDIVKKIKEFRERIRNLP